MNPSDDDRLAATIREHLDRGVADLRPGLAYRLAQARAAALARNSETATEDAGVFAPTPTLVGAGGPRISSGAPSPRPFYARVRVWIGVAALAAAAVGWQQWQAWQELEALEDLDIKILTSELPIDAYVDRGFQQWLKTGAPAE